MEGAKLTLSTEFLAELLKLVYRISLSRETATRKEWGRVDVRQWNCYIRCILRCAITVVLILGAVVLVLIVLVLVVFTLILYKRCVDLLFGALLLTDYQI